MQGALVSADAQPSSPAPAASSLRKAPAIDVGFRSNSAVRPTNSEGLLLLGQAAKSCLAAFGRLLPFRFAPISVICVARSASRKRT